MFNRYLWRTEKRCSDFSFFPERLLAFDSLCSCGGGALAALCEIKIKPYRVRIVLIGQLRNGRADSGV